MSNSALEALEWQPMENAPRATSIVKLFSNFRKYCIFAELDVPENDYDECKYAVVFYNPVMGYWFKDGHDEFWPVKPIRFVALTPKENK